MDAMATPIAKDAASPVSQAKQGRVQDLGRGSCSKNLLQSPQSSVQKTDVKLMESAHHSGGDGVGVSGQLTGTPQEVARLYSSAVSGLVGPSNPGPSSAGVADSDQQHTDEETVVQRPSKTQIRNARRRIARQSKASGVSGAGAKRPRSDGNTPSPLTKEAPKKQRREDLSGSYAAAVAAVKMAVVRASYPSTKLTSADVDSLQMAILVKTDLVSAGESLPAVLGCSLIRGALVVQCGDSATADWVKASFDGNTEVLGDEALKVMSAKDLPKPFKVAFRTKDIYTVDHSVFLKRLARLNPELKSAEWRVLQVSVEQRSARWIFEVEQEDVEAIRRLNCGALTGLDRGVFKILHDPQRGAPISSCEEKEAAGRISPDASSEVSTGKTESLLGLSELALDSDAEGTLTPSSPMNIGELDEAIGQLQGSESIDPSHDISQKG